MILPTKTLLALLPFLLRVQAGASGTGTTTRYWDCCKPSCAWSGKTALLGGTSAVTTCDISDNPLTDLNAASGCNGGSAYQCSNESPWAVSDDLAYGYAAVNIAGGSEESWCCACYELTFTSGAVAGKKMVVQATNTGGDLSGNQFDISIPGGGVGIFNGCTQQWGAPSSGWGAQYGGISSRSDCDSFPEALQAGCYWRFDWFGGSDNPTVSFEQVSCPAALTANTGCVRADDGSAAPAAVASSSVDSKAASTVTSATSESPAATSEASVSSAVSSDSSSETLPSSVEVPVVTSVPATTMESLPQETAVQSENSSANENLTTTASADPASTSPASTDSGDDDTCEWEFEG